MKMPMYRFNNKFLPWVITSGLLALGLNLGCDTLSKEEQDELHRPRKDAPRLQQKAGDPIPLVGLFVDASSMASSPDGKSWATAFQTIQDAIDASSGQDIIVAAGVYKNPNLRIHDKLNVYLKGGYKPGDKFEKDRSTLKSDELVILDGELNNAPLVHIDGQSQRINFQGGFVFKNVRKTPAVIIQGTDAAHPIKDVSITKSRFENNHNDLVGANGGGIRAQFVEDLGLVDVEAYDNQTPAAGGFLYAADIKGLDLVGGILKNNRAEFGGAVYLARTARLDFANALVEGNEANHGGGVYVQGLHNQVIKNVQFVKNKGPAAVGGTQGGGMMIKDCRALRLLGASFVDNRLNMNLGSTSKGAGLYLEDSIDVTLDFGDARIEGNKSAIGGAIAIRKSAAASQSKDIVIQGGFFEGNEALEDAGAVYAFGTENITLRGSKFVANLAARGGAIQIKNPAGTVRLEGLTLDSNRARQGGGLALSLIRAGALFLEGSLAAGPVPHVIIENSTITNSRAVGNGGAVVAQNVDYTVEFKRTLFRDNRSDNFGGALALDANTKTAARFIIGEGTQFFNNSSARGAGGGAIYLAVNTTAIPAPLTAQDRNLVFYIKHADQKDNATGTVMVAGLAQPNSTNRFGKFLRVGNQGISDIMPPDKNPATIVSPRVLAAPGWLFRRYVAYSLNPAHDAAPWNQLKLNWQNVSESEVYAW